MPDVHADAAPALALIVAVLGAVGAGAGPLGATAQGADKAPVFLAINSIARLAYGMVRW